MDEAEQTTADLGFRVMMLHLSALSPTTRASHAARHGKLYTVQDVRIWYTQNANPINCYLPGTRVRGRFVAGSKARYQGLAIDLVGADGSHLSVTPNHPVMTTRGLVAAAEVKESDYLVAYRPELEHSVGVPTLDGEAMGARIEDVFGALANTGHAFRSGVSAVDFHGDGANMHEHVDIVRADRVLPVAIDSAGGQLLDNLALEHAHAVASICSPFSLALDRIRLATTGLVRSLRVTFPFLRRTLGVSEQGTFVGSSRRPAVSIKSLGEPSASDAGTFADRLYRLSQQMGCIQLVEVVSAKRRVFDGHVYDLQEVSGLMVANGIIASNCKCTQVETLVDDKGVPLVPGVLARAEAWRK